jgi:uncharacterized protein YdaU (DUF1376 family)
MKEGQTFRDWLEGYHARRDTPAMIRYVRETPHTLADVDRLERDLLACRARVAEKRTREQIAAMKEKQAAARAAKAKEVGGDLAQGSEEVLNMLDE